MGEDEQPVVVGIIDSGIDANHIDLNVVGSRSFIAGDATLPNDASSNVDNYGHGTHVAGIVGAKNQGRGIVGVSPGVALFALKVLDGNGVGSLSEMLNAVKWVATEGYKLGIGVINLSMAVTIDPSAAMFDVTYGGICAFFKEANDVGVVVVAAAANSGVNFQGFFPACCQETVTVTALDAVGRAPGLYSNWMPAPSPATMGTMGPVLIKSQELVMAAPGTMIRSTMTCGRVESGYMTLSGTSMAAPHVAAVVANCILSGYCAQGVGGVGKFLLVQRASRQRRYMPGRSFFGFSGDAETTMNGRFYGYLVWGDQF
eukprot:gene7590-7794_t